MPAVCSLCSSSSQRWIVSLICSVSGTDSSQPAIFCWSRRNSSLNGLVDAACETRASSSRCSRESCFLVAMHYLYDRPTEFVQLLVRDRRYPSENRCFRHGTNRGHGCSHAGG